MIALAWLVVLLWPATVGGAGLPAWCWQPPVDAAVADVFRAPPCQWCPGNRGIEYDVSPGQAVRAVAGGRVSFAGAVAGQRFVTVELGNDWRVTYARLASVAVDGGAAVVAGQVIGATGATFIFTLRRGDTYVDPGPSIGRPRARPHLVPADGSPGRRAPPVRLSCPARSPPAG